MGTRLYDSTNYMRSRTDLGLTLKELHSTNAVRLNLTGMVNNFWDEYALWNRRLQLTTTLPAQDHSNTISVIRNASYPRTKYPLLEHSHLEHAQATEAHHISASPSVKFKSKGAQMPDSQIHTFIPKQEYTFFGFQPNIRSSPIFWSFLGTSKALLYITPDRNLAAFIH